ncbi:hypothetical protein ACWPOB_23230 [Rhodococcus sp. 2H158]
MQDTAGRGIQAFISEVIQRGGRAERLEHLPRNPVQVWGVDGDSCIVRVRAKIDGDWQARRQDALPDADDTGSQFWVFVDLGSTPVTYFVLPSDEVVAGIAAEVDIWMADARGRTRTGSHAIPLSSVVHGKDRWDLLGLTPAKDTTRYTDDDAAEAEAERLARNRARKASASGKARGAAEPEVAEDPRLPVLADWDGYRVKGRFDPATGVLEITAGPMEGRRFPDPTTAAVAVASYLSGDVESCDGGMFWRLDQPESTPLGAHLA